MKKMKIMLTLLLGLCLFVGGGLFAEDLSQPVPIDGTSIEYAIVATDQATLVNITLVKNEFVISPIVNNYSETLVSSIYCANVGLDILLVEDYKELFIRFNPIGFLVINEGKATHELRPIWKPSNYSLYSIKSGGLILTTYNLA